MNKPIPLSEPIAGIIKYLAPFIIAFVSTGWYISNKPDILIPSLIIIVGLIYWIFQFLPLKSVQLDGDYLIISNDFKKDKVHLDEIENLKTGSWSMYITHIKFKNPTKFGDKIFFATMQKSFGTGISERVENILKQIKVYVENNKK